MLGGIDLSRSSRPRLPVVELHAPAAHGQTQRCSLPACRSDGGAAAAAAPQTDPGTCQGAVFNTLPVVGKMLNYQPTNQPTTNAPTLEATATGGTPSSSAAKRGVGCAMQKQSRKFGSTM